MNYRVFILPFSLLVLSGISFADSVAPKSTYDWTGVYVGGFVGGATGANATSSVERNVMADGIIGYNTSSSSNYSLNSSFIGGGTVGYNWQIPKTPYLIGLEGEYGYLGQSGSSQSQGYSQPLQSNTQNKTTIGSEYGYGLVGGRIGYALDRSLFYIKSGAVFTEVNSTNTTISTTDGSPGNQQSSADSGGTKTGFALGGGLEYVPTWYSNKNVTVKIEYLYFGIPTSTQSSSSVTFPYQDSVDFNASNHNSTSGIHTAKIGVNYKF